MIKWFDAHVIGKKAAKKLLKGAEALGLEIIEIGYDDYQPEDRRQRMLASLNRNAVVEVDDQWAEMSEGNRGFYAMRADHAAKFRKQFNIPKYL